MRSNFIFIFALACLISCASGHCRRIDSAKAPEEVSAETSPTTESTPIRSTHHVKVYKYDGTLQCGMGQLVKIDEMKKQLADCTVYSQERKHDGRLRPQVCRAQTGWANVYEISADDLDKALRNGFKLWTFD